MIEIRCGQGISVGIWGFAVYRFMPVSAPAPNLSTSTCYHEAIFEEVGVAVTSDTRLRPIDGDAVQRHWGASHRAEHLKERNSPASTTVIRLLIHLRRAK